VNPQEPDSESCSLVAAPGVDLLNCGALSHRQTTPCPPRPATMSRHGVADDSRVRTRRPGGRTCALAAPPHHRRHRGPTGVRRFQRRRASGAGGASASESRPVSLGLTGPDSEVRVLSEAVRVSTAEDERMPVTECSSSESPLARASSPGG
jgi:hypothetical protein